MSDNNQTKTPLSTALVTDPGKSRNEFFKETAKDVNEFAKESGSFLEEVHIPILATILSFMSWGYSRWEARLVSEFFHQLSIPLAFGNMGKAIELIGANLHKKPVAEAMARGWRLAMETMDDTARIAAYAMVADYLAQERKTDRLFQQLGNLLKESDKTILSQILEISDALAEIRESSYGDVGIVMTKPHERPDADPPPAGTPDELQFHMISGQAGGKYKLLSADLNLFETLEILQRNTLSGEWIVDKWEHPLERVFSIEDHSGFVNTRQLKKWEQLRKYLAPLRAQLVE